MTATSGLNANTGLAPAIHAWARPPLHYRRRDRSLGTKIPSREDDMPSWPYTKGVHDLGTGCYAYLQPDGTWGWSNAGLVADSGESLLVDTLFDLKCTREMLSALRAAVPAASRIGTLVNTHANGDHTFGNQLVDGAQIIASRRCAEEMKERPPGELA